MYLNHILINIGYNGISWDLIVFNSIYDVIPSGYLLLWNKRGFKQTPVEMEVLFAGNIIELDDRFSSKPWLITRGYVSLFSIFVLLVLSRE